MKICVKPKQDKGNINRLFSTSVALSISKISSKFFFFAIFVPAAASSVKLAKTTVYRRSNKLKIALWKYRRNGVKYSLVISVTVAFPGNSFVANSLQL